MTSIHYRQGSPVSGSHSTSDGWLAAVCENRLVLVQGPTALDAESRIAALWDSINSSQGIQAVLDELTRGGVSATPPFALVEWAAGLGTSPVVVRAIIRGAVRLVVRTADGTVAKDASGVSTWLEHEYSQVLGFDVEVSSATTKTSAVPLPLVAGMAWVDTVTVGSFEATADSTAVAVPAKAAEKPAAKQEKQTGFIAEPVVAPVWTDPEETVTELTISPEAPSSAAVPAAPEAPAADGSAYDYLFGETVFRTVEDAAVREEDGTASDSAAPTTNADSLAPDELDAGDHDGHTIASSDIAKLRAARKARKASAAPAASVPAGPILYLALANGARESLAEPILVGRAPSVSQVSGGQIPRLLTIAGPDQDISRNHAQFAVSGGTVVVTDLHSRNGTIVILPGRPPQQLRQGEPTSVIVGTVVDLGGGVTFTVCEE